MVAQQLISRRSLLVSGLISATAGVGVALPDLKRSNIHSYMLDTRIPQSFGGFQYDPSIVPILPDSDEQKAVARAYENTLVRAYRTADDRLVMMVIAHGRPDSGMLAIHRPAICYAAQGFDIEPMGRALLGEQFPKLSVDHMFASRDSRQEPVLYWAIIGREQTDVGIEQKVRMVLGSLRGAPTDAFLVRVSTIGPNTTASYALLNAFAQALLSSLDAVTRADLGGSPT